MILGGGYLQLPLIQEINNRGYHSIVVDYDKSCDGFKIASEILFCSTQDYESIDEYISNNPIDAILTIATDRPMLVVSKIADKYGLISTSYESAALAINKSSMRQKLKEKNINVPDFRVVFDIDEYFSILREMSRYENLIVKSSDNSGKKGITKINVSDNRESLAQAYNYSKENSSTNEVIVEEQLFGLEYSVESITYNGKTEIIAVTNKINTGEPHFVEIGHYQPAEISYEDYLKITTIVVKTIKALKLNNIGTHIEVMLTKKGPYIIEVGPRLGGDNISTKLTRASTGVDMISLVLDISLGKKIHYNIEENHYAYIYYFQKYVEKKDIEQIVPSENIIEINVLKKENDNVIIKNSSERFAYIIIKANNKTKIKNIIKTIQRFFN